MHGGTVAGPNWSDTAVGALEWYDEYQFESDEGKPKHYMRGGIPGKYPAFGGLPLNLYDPFKLFKKMTEEAYPYDFDPWSRPGPKTHAYLQLGFALARANARMLLHADSTRRSTKNRVRTSRLRSPAGPES